jgi:hypothetical protein
VVKNKIKSMLGKPICIDHVPHFNVGQDPLQGDLRETKPIEQGQPIQFKRREPEVLLSEAELADMLSSS